VYLKKGSSKVEVEVEVLPKVEVAVLSEEDPDELLDAHCRKEISFDLLVDWHARGKVLCADQPKKEDGPPYWLLCRSTNMINLPAGDAQQSLCDAYGLLMDVSRILLAPSLRQK